MRRRGFIATLGAMVAARKFKLPPDNVVWERKEDAQAQIRTGLPSTYWRLANTQDGEALAEMLNQTNSAVTNLVWK